MHRLLERQLRRYLDSVDPIPEEWKRFIDAVDETYRQTDVDRTLLERSLDLTSEELFERNQQLEKIVDDLQKAMAEQEQAKTEAENARRQLEVALEEARAIHRRYQRQAWEGYAVGAKVSLGYTLSDGSIKDLSLTEGHPTHTAHGTAKRALGITDTERSSEDIWTPAMTAALEQVETVIETHTEQEGQTLAIPIRPYGEIIGALSFYRPGPERWRDNEIAAVEDIVEQVGWALENQRLFDEAQQASFLLGEQVKGLDCLNDIGRKIDEAPPAPEFLEWVAERIPQAMQHSDVCLVAIEFQDRIYGAVEATKLPRQIVGKLQVSGEQMGRITIAYTKDHYFLKQESAMLEDIARRISGYIENRRLMETTQTALAEAAATHRSYLRQEWQDYLQKEQALRQNAIVYDQEQVTSVPEFWRPEMELALTKGDLVTIEDLESRTGLAIPIVVRGQTLGVLGVEYPDRERKWSAEELDLIQAIGQQLGQALENTRLIEATQRRAARERLTGEVTTRMRETMDVNTVLQTAVHEMRQVLGLHDIVIRLEDTNGDPVTPTDSNRAARPGRQAEQDEEVSQ